jgi:antitoxin YefM
MNVASFSETRAHLAELMDRVVEDRNPLVITRQKNPSVVMVAYDEWLSIAETMHLLSSPANARRLLDAVATLEAGGGEDRTSLLTATDP